MASEELMAVAVRIADELGKLTKAVTEVNETLQDFDQGGWSPTSTSMSAASADELEGPWSEGWTEEESP